MNSEECPCGIARADCDYHKPEPAKASTETCKQAIPPSKGWVEPTGTYQAKWNLAETPDNPFYTSESVFAKKESWGSWQHVWATRHFKAPCKSTLLTGKWQFPPWDE